MCGFVDDIADGLGDIVGGIGDTIGDVAGGIGDAVGGVWDGLQDSGIGSILGTLGTVIPGPWTPFAVGYNVANAASQGNVLGAGLSALGGAGALGGLGGAADAASGGLGDIAASAGAVGDAGAGAGSALNFGDFGASAADSLGSSANGLNFGDFTGAAGAGAADVGQAAGGISQAAGGLGGIASGISNTGAPGLGGLLDKGLNWVTSNPGKALKIGGSILDTIGAKQAQSAFGNNLQSLNNLYSPTGAYADEMKKTLARQDAARGRRSQYGTRATQLAAGLTQQQAAMQNSPAYLAQLGASSNKAIPYGSIAKGLSELF